MVGTMLSLFDGSGGFPLAGRMVGIEAVMASEIEPYPIAVTRSRFPDMKHLGSVTEIRGDEIEPVDVITFGSPCQDLSIAGTRTGMKHEEQGDEETTRSGLFHEAVRIIREMRKATSNVYPRFAVWENVYGAFSSNRGEDFRKVLESFIQIAEPTAVMPPIPKGGWNYFDSYCGDGWSLAYRTVDAQYWGVPQRRRRIYLVADFGGERASEILFECKGLYGHSSESGEEGQEAPRPLKNRSGTADRENERIDEYSLKIRSGCDGGGKGALIQTNKSATLSTNNDQYLFAPVYAVENHPADSRVKIDESGTVQTLTSRMGTGGGNVPMVMERTCYDARGNGDGKTTNTLTGDHNNRVTDYTVLCVEPTVYNGENITSPTNKANPKPGDPCHTLSTDSRNYLCYCLQGNGIDRADTAGCEGRGWRENESYTLNTMDRHAVAYGEKVWSLDRAAYNQGENAKYDFEISDKGTAPTIVARGPSAVAHKQDIQYIVRRLTPTECARLQGFPDAWGHPDKKDDFTDEEYAFWLDVRNTHAAINDKQVKEYTKEQMIKWYNKLHTDSAEYKMWGNGICLFNALFVMRGIARVLRREKDGKTD